MVHGASRGPGKSLLQRLRHANPRELQTLVQDHARELTIREVRQILLNPFTDASVLEELFSTRSLTAAYEVRAALCRDRRSPQHASMRFLAGLRWRDLMEIAGDSRIHPGVRRVAEKYICQRMPRLTLGEKINLARRATAPVLALLLTDPNGRVVNAVLDSPRTTESLVLDLASNPKAPPRILLDLGKHARWGRTYDVRVALSRNTQTPFQVLLELLPALQVDDLLAVASLEAHSSLIRNRAADLAETRQPSRQLTFDRIGDDD